jgi:Ni,Fe-hydrogenase III component G
VTPLTPQADWAEQEMIEFLGIKAEEHPNPTHLWLPVNWEQMYSEAPRTKALSSRSLCRNRSMTTSSRCR